MIDTVIFDLGRVLVDYNGEKLVKDFEFSEDIYEKIVNSFLKSEKRLEYDRSKMSDIELINMFVEDFPEHRKEFEMVFYNEDRAVVERDYAKQWIIDLKNKGLKVYLLSNYARNTYNITKDKLKFLDNMDGKLFSWEVNQVKPEKEIYQSLIEKYDLIPENCVFIDDKSENLEGAEVFGIKTILFTTKEEADSELEKLGIK